MRHRAPRTDLHCFATGLPIRLAAIFAVLTLLIAALPAALLAQSTATIETEARGADGAPLPGVSVHAERVETGADRRAVTGAEGFATLKALSPGEYTVTFELDGFAPVVQEGLTLLLGQTVSLVAEMRPAAASDEIVVTAEAPLVDVFKLDASSNISPEQIEELPVADRDFQRLAFIVPGVQRERGSFRFIQGGPVIGAGGNASNATILVDGVDLTDPTNGLARARFSQDAIREFRVVTNRFDTEIGGSAGGALSIITKTGSNDLSGNVFGFFRDDALREKRELEEAEVPFSREQYGLNVGGALSRDKAHYFVSLEQISEDNVTLFRPRGAFADLAEDVSQPFDQTLGYVGFNFQLDDDKSLAIKGVYEDFEQENFRVGGVNDVVSGQRLLRENWNFMSELVTIHGDAGLNELRVQFGSREFFEPRNSTAVSEWFSSGNTLQTGGNILGDLLGTGDQWEIRDTYRMSVGDHDLKFGASWFSVEERSIIDTFASGLFTYAFDDRTLPIAFLFGEGSSDTTIKNDIFGAFIQDDWRVSPRLTLSLGLRYDLDTEGNNSGFTHPLVPEPRDRDEDNLQPRIGFSWDMTGDGESVLRGGVGLFTGRYLLIPALIEQQQNGITGRVARRNVNGLLFGLPPAFWLDPANPFTTGIPLAPDIGLIASELDAPESVQVTLGYTRRLGATGLYLDVEGVYVEGDDEIVVRDTNFGGNANPVRPNLAFSQINTYTNEGRSEYEALIVGVNGTIGRGHVLTASVTLADKKNISDDFSPAFPFGYPDDPADIEAEFGRSRSDEPFRVVVSGIFRLPWDLTLAPIWEYGDGQPWNHRLGYDWNGDGKNSDRPEGVARNSEDGPRFTQLSLRLTKTISLGNSQLDLIAEVFNAFDTTNFDPSSIDGAEFLSGPTVTNPDLAFIPNPNFGQAFSTFAGREAQLGVRWRF